MTRRGRISLAGLLRRKLLGAMRRLARFRLGPEERLRGEVTVAGGTWRVEIAMTPRRRYVGLGGRDRLDEGAGMLFLYPDAAVRKFSMRGCLIPLDIAFLSPSLEVVSLCTMAVEPDRVGRVQYISAAPARYVLETPAGELARAGVVVGSKAVLAGVPAAIWSSEGVG